MAAEADRPRHRGGEQPRYGGGGPSSYQEMREEPAYLVHELKLQTLTEQGQAQSNDSVAAGISRLRDVGWIIQPSSVTFYHLKTASHLATWRFEGIVLAVVEVSVSGVRMMLVSCRDINVGNNIPANSTEAGVSGTGKLGGRLYWSTLAHTTRAPFSAKVKHPITSMIELKHEPGTIVCGNSVGHVSLLGCSTMLELGATFSPVFSGGVGAEAKRSRAGMVTALLHIEELGVVLVGYAIGLLEVRSDSDISKIVSNKVQLPDSPPVLQFVPFCKGAVLAVQHGNPYSGSGSSSSEHDSYYTSSKIRLYNLVQTPRGPRGSSFVVAPNRVLTSKISSSKSEMCGPSIVAPTGYQYSLLSPTASKKDLRHHELSLKVSKALQGFGMHKCCLVDKEGESKSLTSVGSIARPMEQEEKEDHEGADSKAIKSDLLLLTPSYVLSLQQIRDNAHDHAHDHVHGQDDHDAIRSRTECFDKLWNDIKMPLADKLRDMLALQVKFELLDTYQLRKEYDLEQDRQTTTTATSTGNKTNIAGAATSKQSHPAHLLAKYLAKSKLAISVLEMLEWLQSKRILDSKGRFKQQSKIRQDYHKRRQGAKRGLKRDFAAYQNFAKRGRAKSQAQQSYHQPAAQQQHHPQTRNTKVEISMHAEEGASASSIPVFASPLHDDIGYLKKIVYEATGIPYDQQRLRVNGHIQEDYKKKLASVYDDSSDVSVGIDYLLVDRMIPGDLNVIQKLGEQDVTAEGLIHQIVDKSFQQLEHIYQMPNPPFEAFDFQDFTQQRCQQIQNLMFYMVIDFARYDEYKAVDNNFADAFALSPQTRNIIKGFHALDSLMTRLLSQDYSKNSNGSMDVDVKENLREAAVAGRLSLFLTSFADRLPETMHCLRAMWALGLEKYATHFQRAVLYANTNAVGTSRLSNSSRSSGGAGSVVCAWYDQLVNVKIFLKNDCWQAALAYIRSQQEQQQRQHDTTHQMTHAQHRLIINHVFNWFRRSGKIIGLVKLRLNVKEQAELEKYLQENVPEPDALILYYLHRGQVEKALSLGHPMFCTSDEKSMSTDSSDRKSKGGNLIERYRETFPSEIFDGSFQAMRKPTLPS